MKSIINRMADNYRQRNRLDREAEIDKGIQIVERAGQFWITVFSVAVLALDSDTTTSEISEMLEQIRQTAKSFDRGEPMNTDDMEEFFPMIVVDDSRSNGAD